GHSEEGTMNSARVETLRRRIGRLTWLFIAGLVLSGATAIPLESELDAVVRMLGVADVSSERATSGMAAWILTVREAVHDTNARYPFVAYGFDWLAFGHFVIAIAFVGALRESRAQPLAVPVRKNCLRPCRALCLRVRR